jgi:hypothetical protein
MNKFLLAVYLILLLCLCSLTFFLATGYQENGTRNQGSFVLWVIDMIDLFIHEAGHLIFSILGKFVGFLGGSLFQIVIPLATVVVFARSSLRSLPFTLYWTGQSIVNVSIYIGDAPFQRLHLISRGAMHDWRWLLGYTGLMEYAGDIAGVVNVLGILSCCAGIGIGFYFVFRDGYQLIRPSIPSPE